MEVPTREPDAPPTTRSSRWDFLLVPGRFAGVLAVGVVVLLIAGTGMVGYRVGAEAANAGLPEEFANVERLFDALQDDAVDSPDDEELVAGAIEGLLSTLEDPYAVYYDADRYSALNADLDGEFVGIGVTIEERVDGVYIVGVLPGSPAEAAGVQAGERIVAVDGADVVDADTTTREIIDRIGGEEGTSVTVTFDMGEAGERSLTMTRQVLDLPAVATRVLDSGFGYAAVAQFSRRVDTQLAAQVQEMVDTEDIPGLVLDLRGNPGGLLGESVEVVSLFAEEGVAVRVESRDGEIERHVLGDAALPDIPLVVLVDGNSASASEIVAGALQDLGRARVVGTQTFGKGTVQTIQDLELGAGVKFTTARYATPSGDSIEGVGVTPDVLTSEDPEEQLAAAEAELARVIAEGPGF